MAIKITGTTVINDSCELQNIGNATDFVKSANFVRPPQLFIDGVEIDDIATEPTLVTSEFAVFGGGSDTHASTDWEVVRTSDSSTVFSSIGDTTNLTSITVTPALDFEEEYLFRVRHNGTSLGASEYREVIGTTGALNFQGQEIGEPICGGFFMGTITAASTCYALIVAPNAFGCASCIWKTSATFTSGAADFCDGYANTYPALENSTHPAGNWTATRTIGGFSDWYLPAVEELRVLYDNGAGAGSGDPLPSGEDLEARRYWSSTDYRATDAYVFYLCCGNQYPYPFSDKDISQLPVRAVRREPI